MTDIKWHPPTPPTIRQDDSRGSTEEHPAYGLLSVKRRTGGDPVLFDSDIKHNEAIVVTVRGATRTRDLKHDWIFDNHETYIEVEMSLAQWASAVSSVNTSGVPCTIRRTQNDWNVPGLEFEPRLALSMEETRAAADVAFGRIERALAMVQALDSKAPAAARRAAMDNLALAIKGAKPGVEFAASSLNEHAENVVSKARADVEAMVVAHATQVGLEAGSLPSVAAIEG